MAFIRKNIALALFSLSLRTTSSSFIGSRPSAFYSKPASESMTRKSTKRFSSVTHNFSSGPLPTEPKTDPLLPTMIVFDLDDCIWSPEMYTLSGTPSIPVQGDLDPSPTKSSSEQREMGTVGMQVPYGPTVQFFTGARKVLRELVLNPKYKGVILAAASSSEEPPFSYACLEGIEIIPGVTLSDVMAYHQIGRTGRLTSRKTTHFALLHEESGINYDEMLFFDDCNWGDHVRDIAMTCGVVGQRTPSGMQFNEFEKGLQSYKAAAEAKIASKEYSENKPYRK